MSTDYGPGLLPHHARLLADSGITPEVAKARGYRSITKRTELRRLGFADAQCRVPALLIPIWNVAGELAIYQLRPDEPRILDAKPVKYETPTGTHVVLDVPPQARDRIGDPSRPLFITEGVRKVDSAMSQGLCCIAPLGVWSWRGTNEHGGKVALPDWEAIALNHRDVYLVFDSDVLQKPEVHAALVRLKAFLETRGAHVRVIYLPPGEGGTKQGLDDFFAAGHTIPELLALAREKLTPPPREEDEASRDIETPERAINVTDRRLTEKTMDALRALQRANTDTPRLFQQGGALVRLRIGEGEPRVEPLTPDALRGELDRAARWEAGTGDRRRLVDPPMAVVRDILARPDWELPELRAIAEAPFFDCEGRLVMGRGYHPESRVFLHSPSALEIPSVPPTPSSDDLASATAQIRNDLLGDFPFVDEASRAHAVGLLLLPFARELIDGPTPLHAIDSPMPGTGKGLLADVISLVVTGRPMEVMTEAKDDEELRKRITALLLAGGPFGLFDNAVRRVSAAPLATLLTTERWKDRILGASRMVSLPVLTTWIVTGNNLEFSRELARRAVWIRMDAKVAAPYLRTGFKHDRLAAWTTAHRGQLLWSALVLIQAWIAQGRLEFAGRTLGRFESWARVIGGILSAAEIEGFLQNLETFTARADAESAAWEQFVLAWSGAHGQKAVGVGDLLPLAAEHIPEVLGDGGDRSQRTRLGTAIAKKTDWIIGGYCISPATAKDEKGRDRQGYALTPVADPQDRTRKPADEGWEVGECTPHVTDAQGQPGKSIGISDDGTASPTFPQPLPTLGGEVGGGKTAALLQKRALSQPPNLGEGGSGVDDHDKVASWGEV